MSIRGERAMKCEKPEFTPLMRDRLNTTYKLLKQRYYTKQELMDILELGDRQVRMIIEEISYRFPVIASSSNNNGYKIANTVEDYEDVERTWAEHTSRVEKLTAKCNPLKAFHDKFYKERYNAKRND